MSILFWFIVLAIAIVGVIYYVNKDKKVSSQSAVSKIATTAGNAISRGIEDIADGIRNPELIRAEIEKQFETVKDKLDNELNRFLLESSRSVVSLQELIRANETNHSKNIAEAKKYYKAYQSDNDEHHLTMSKEFASLALENKQMIESANDNLKIIDKREKQVSLDYSRKSASLINKRSKIMLSLHDPNIQVNLEIEKLNDLVAEFNKKASKQEVINIAKEKVNAIKGDDIVNHITTTLSDDEFLSLVGGEPAKKTTKAKSKTPKE